MRLLRLQHCDIGTIETSETSTLCVGTRQMSVLATEEISAVETEQMSSVETRQMSAIETGRISAVETNGAFWLKHDRYITGQRPV